MPTGEKHTKKDKMEQEEETKYDSMVMLLVKDEEIHVSSSTSMTTQSLLELLAEATLALKNIMEETSKVSGQVH